MGKVMDVDRRQWLRPVILATKRQNSGRQSLKSAWEALCETLSQKYPTQKQG
jgi:hypothetical protein